MSTYVFKAMDLAGVKARGELEGDSKQAVSDQLKQRGLIVLDIADKHGSREIELSFLKRVKAGDLAVFSRQLATMITSGMSILRSLYVLEEQTENKFLRETIVAVRKDVEAGLSLSDSMARHRKVFSPLFVAMTQAGEAGGVLEESLLRVADQLEKDASLRRQIKSAMIYPALVITFAVGVMLALVAFRVPVLLALEITGKTGGNVTIEEAMDGVIASVKRGGTIAAPLAQAPIFPTMVTHMVGVGEETGALDEMLDKIADFYEDQVEASVKALTSILEPVMIILIGGIVGFIVVSMYMPLFTVYNNIK